MLMYLHCYVDDDLIASVLQSEVESIRFQTGDDWDQVRQTSPEGTVIRDISLRLRSGRLIECDTFEQGGLYVPEVS